MKMFTYSQHCEIIKGKLNRVAKECSTLSEFADKIKFEGIKYQKFLDSNEILVYSNYIGNDTVIYIVNFVDGKIEITDKVTSD